MHYACRDVVFLFGDTMPTWLIHADSYGENATEKEAKCDYNLYTIRIVYVTRLNRQRVLITLLSFFA